MNTDKHGWARPALLFCLAAGIALAQFGRQIDFTGVWKLEMDGADPKAASLLDVKMDGKLLTGKLKTPHGEFPIENGSVDGADLFFNVVIKREEYALRATYRGHLFSEEIQFTVEAGERMRQMIAKRVETKGKT
ncbi:MAG: hypothetical protein FJW20_08675 [Acidimicrobiia bacterium]|nr:hypothetical protein [Acidimicrobiia bacterium]